MGDLRKLAITAVAEAEGVDLMSPQEFSASSVFIASDVPSAEKRWELSDSMVRLCLAVMQAQAAAVLSGDPAPSVLLPGCDTDFETFGGVDKEAVMRYLGESNIGWANVVDSEGPPVTDDRVATAHCLATYEVSTVPPADPVTVRVSSYLHEVD